MTFGNNISVSHYSKIISGGHDWNDPNFEGVFLPILIEDYAWIGVQTIILQGVTVGKGTVIASGCLINKDAAPNSLYAGIPARKIKERSKEMNYHPLEKEQHFRFF